MENPNAESSAADVMVITHCAPAGLSIERHYTTLCLFFPRHHAITHRLEFQFARRLRERPGLYRRILAYIEGGKIDGKLANQQLVCVHWYQVPQIIS